jgi:hypothetical protein
MPLEHEGEGGTPKETAVIVEAEGEETVTLSGEELWHHERAILSQELETTREELTLLLAEVEAMKSRPSPETMEALQDRVTELELQLSETAEAPPLNPPNEAEEGPPEKVEVVEVVEAEVRPERLDPPKEKETEKPETESPPRERYNKII